MTLLDAVDDLPQPDKRPESCVLQLWVNLTAYHSRILAVFDGGAELPVLSNRIYQQMQPQPELRPTTERLRGLYGPAHTPLGQCTLQIEIPELAVRVTYEVVVDNIAEDFLVDASLMNYMGINVRYTDKLLERKGRTTRGVARLRGEGRVRRLQLAQDWLVEPRSRQLVPGRSLGGDAGVSSEWMVEPCHSVTEKTGVLVGQTLCRGTQVNGVIPVEVYNPWDEPIQLFKNTTLGLVNPLQEVTDIQFATTEKMLSKVIRTNKSTPVEPLPEELQALVEEAGEEVNDSVKNDFAALLADIRDLFVLKGQKLGQTNVVKHDIVTSGAPIKSQFRRVPWGVKEEAMKEEQRMKDMGVIEPSESPWAAPVVMVRKKDGCLRYCIDYRKLNEVTKKDSYPLPNIQDCLDSLDGAKYFSSMDLCSGYWQVQLTDDAKDKTSFYGVGGGLWRFTVMPFGLCNAPATFERLMERVLRQLQWQICLCYIDDVLVYSRTPSEHLLHLTAVFQRLKQANLKLKPSKCHFFKRRVVFLGHIVTADGVSTDPEKVKKVQDWPPPQDIHEVRCALGLFSYYRRFIPNFSTVAKPLVVLTEKNQPFKWGATQQAAFDRLKELFGEAPILAHPRSDGDFILDTDASNEGIGAVLSQIQDGEERVIAFASKTLSRAERNYCITRRELLAVVVFCEQFKHFLVGRKFEVRTDNSAVRYWTKLQTAGYDPMGQVARWLVRLAPFDFDIKHRAGRYHGNADGMSRRPFLMCAQCEIRHEGALTQKRQPKKTQESSSPEVSSPLQSSQTEVRESVRLQIPSRTPTGRRQPVKTGDMSPLQSEAEVRGSRTTPGAQVETSSIIQPLLHSGGGRGEESCGDVRMEISAGDESSVKPGKARVLTRGQSRTSTGPETSQGAAPSWLEGGVGLTQKIILEEQRKDPASVEAIMWLHNGYKPTKEEIISTGPAYKFLWSNMDCLAVVNGILCRKIGPLADGSVKTTVYLPPSLRKKATSACHDTVTAGHFYYWKTLKKVKQHFTWEGINRDVLVYCRACHICATRKNAGRQQKAEMRHYSVGSPMEEVAIDLMGPFPESDAGNKYVVVLVDSFSKWVEAYAIPNMEAKTVAEKIVIEFVSRFGVPQQFKTDRGRQFECEVFAEMCKLLEADHKMSTPFHPQGNSRVERMVKVVGNLISSFCREYKNWDQNLPLLTLAYRSTIHEVTGYTPNFVMTGREAWLPLDVMMVGVAENPRASLPEYVEQLKDRLETCFASVRVQLKKHAERQKRYYNLKSHGLELQKGDLVYLKETTRKKGISPKLAPKWKGPYAVVAKFGTVYELLISPTTTKVYHFDLLKRAYGDTPPWIRRAFKRLGIGPPRDLK